MTTDTKTAGREAGMHTGTEPSTGAVNEADKRGVRQNRMPWRGHHDGTYLYQQGFRILLIPVLLSLPILSFSDLWGEDTGTIVLTRILLSGLVVVPIYVANIFCFTPMLLKAGKYWAYFLLIAIGCALTVWLGYALIHALLPASELLNNWHGKPTRFIGPIMGLALSLSTFVDLSLQWESQRRKSAQVEKEKIELELAFLKAQVNPHFLFNTINNIHAMSELKSDKTSDAILMLSDLLRYTLYGTNQGSVPLQKEIESIENYIALQRLRLPKRDSIAIRFDTNGNLGSSLIEPQLLLPFVENAFKHGISYQQPSAILIDLHVEHTVLEFRVHNTKWQTLSQLDESDDSGIGLTNIRRRLTLLYPGKHDLQIQSEADLFEIRLTVQL